MNKSILSSLALAVILLSGLSACVQPAVPAGPTAALPASTAPLPTPTEPPPAPTGAPLPTGAPEDSLILTTAPEASWQAQAPDPLALLARPRPESKPLAAAFSKAAPVAPKDAALRQELAAAGSATLTVKNDSAYTVCYLYISPVTSDSWGSDWLGDDETLPPGATVRFTLAPGQYDALARDCDRRVIEEVRGGTISGRTTWTITGEEGGAEAAPTARPAATARPGATARPAATPLPAATPRPVALDQFLCCGRTAGETRIWGISYPRGWQVTLLPEDPNYFLGALFTDPRSSMRIIVIPSGWTPMGTAMDTGDVDQYLDALAAARARKFPGFREFYRQPLSGVPGRVWAGTWKQGDLQYWESLLVMVTAMPYVENMPRGGLTLMGLSAESSEWNQASAIYERMLGTIQVEVISSGPAYQPQPGPSDDPMEQGTAEAGSAASSFWELVFCPKKCDWEYIDVNNQPAGSVWDCSDGCRGYLSQVPCTAEWCR